MEQNEQFKQKFALLQLASGKKILAPVVVNEQTPDDSFEYVPPKPKGKRFTTARAPLNKTITVEELMSPSEEEEAEEEEEEEWCPKKTEKRPSNSRKSKATGCSCKGRCSNRLCRCRKGKMTCGENCQCDHEKCRNMENKGSAAKDSSLTQTVLKEVAVSPQEPESVSPDNTTFFKPPTCTPTKKALKDIGETVGHDTEDLLKRTIMTEQEEEEEDDGRTTVTFLKKKKRLLTSFQNSFFSGCTPIMEDC